MSFSPLVQQLIESLRCLPGVGPKSAQRMAFYLLQHQPKKADHLCKTLERALALVGRCQLCRTLTEEPFCTLCRSDKRDRQLLCIVEHPSDILAIEQTASYRGLYFVLTGHLSPIDGIGPEQIGIPILMQYLQTHSIREIILALNPTVEGQTTAHFIASKAKTFCTKITRLAQGIPMGSELEYTDGNTLAHALMDRTIIES